MYRTLFLIAIILPLIGCQSKNTPIQKAIVSIESSWPPDKLKEFGAKPDSVALSEVHFGQAMTFRNQELRNPRDSTLLKYFHSLGIYHEDYMSGIVFTSLHRKLNKKPINLDAQIANIHFIMDEVKERETKNISRAEEYYSKYQIGDTVIVRMPIDKSSAYSHSYPENSKWIHNDSLDLLIKGIILLKKESSDTYDMFFNLKMLSKNRDSIKILMEEVYIGDTMEVDLLHDIVESID